MHDEKYGNNCKLPASVNMAMERGSASKNIPVAQSNQCGSDKKFDRARLAVWRMSMTANALNKRKPMPPDSGRAY